MSVPLFAFFLAAKRPIRECRSGSPTFCNGSTFSANRCTPPRSKGSGRCCSPARSPGSRWSACFASSAGRCPAISTALKERQAVRGDWLDIAAVSALVLAVATVLLARVGDQQANRRLQDRRHLHGELDGGRGGGRNLFLASAGALGQHAPAVPMRCWSPIMDMDRRVRRS